MLDEYKMVNILESQAVGIAEIVAKHYLKYDVISSKRTGDCITVKTSIGVELIFRLGDLVDFIAKKTNRLSYKLSDSFCTSTYYLERHL